MPRRVGQLLIGLVGVQYAFAGAALLLAPDWFYTTFGQFPPFNRHYAGDAGAFVLPIGAGLVLAAVYTRRLWAVVLLGLGASWLHAANHLYDAIANAGHGQASLADAGLIVASAVALTVGALLTTRASEWQPS